MQYDRNGLDASLFTLLIILKCLGPGDTVVVSIESVNARERKISLNTGKKEDVADWKEYKPGSGDGFGSLGEALARAMKKK